MRAGDWVYMCALLKYVCVCVRWAVRSAPTESRYVASVKRYPDSASCIPSSMLLTRRWYPLYYVFFPSVLINVMAASIIITRRVSHSSLSFPQCEWGSGFSILPAKPALSSSIHPSLPSFLPSFLPQPRQAHPAQEIHGDNGWCYWVWVLGFVAPDWLKRRGASYRLTLLYLIKKKETLICADRCKVPFQIRIL